MSDMKLIIPPSMRGEFKAMLRLAMEELLKDDDMDIPFAELPMDPEEYEDDWEDEYEEGPWDDCLSASPFTCLACGYAKECPHAYFE